MPPKITKPEELCGSCGKRRDPDVPWQWKDTDDRPLCLACVKKRIAASGPGSAAEKSSPGSGEKP